MKSVCCGFEVYDDWNVWRCGSCKKPLVYNTFRGDGSLESQINEKIKSENFSFPFANIHPDDIVEA